MEDIISTAQQVFDMEIQAMTQVRNSIGDNFQKILECIMNCKGKVIITGMGKSGHVARKIAATMSSLGTSAIFLHPGEAMHGDLGMIQQEDVVIAISYSGESNEIISILPNIRIIGAKLIGITNNAESTLAHKCDISEVFPHIKEACFLGLAPTSSTTTVMAYGDALAVTAAKVRDFRESDFGVFHPAGSLGKKIVYRVKDLMQGLERRDIVESEEKLKDTIIKMNRVGLGILGVVNRERELVGVITDGAIERAINEGIDIYKVTIDDLIQYNPIYINYDAMAIEALEILIKYDISAMLVLKDERVVGIIRRETIINTGIYI